MQCAQPAAEGVMSPLVKAVQTAVYAVPTEQPEADGTLAWDTTTVVAVRVQSEAHTGIGWTYASAAAAGVVEEHLASVVEGADALSPGGANEQMSRAVRNVGRQGVAACAISAVDVALWDLKAKLLDLPLHRLIGTVRHSVPVYGSGGFTSYDDATMRRQLEHWVGEQQIPRVKIKVGERWGTEEARDLRRMALARDVIGDDADLFVDANGGYHRKQAVRVARRAADCGVTWFEEPVSSDDLDGLRAVRDRVDCDVTAGEYGYDLPYFERMSGHGAVDCLQIDVTRCGGVTVFMRAAAVAAAHGLDVSAHCAPSLHAAVATATPNLRHIEWFHDHVRIDGLLFDGALDPYGGTITPRDDAPGIGVELRDADADRFRAR
jgi:L-alanine-DL-glutamate epimerase-like enolase superfamily enzyme